MRNLLKTITSDKNSEVTKLPGKKQGRPLASGKKLDSQVEAFLKQLCENGAMVNMAIVMATAKGIVQCLVYFWKCSYVSKYFFKNILSSCFWNFNLSKISRYTVVWAIISACNASYLLPYRYTWDNKSVLQPYCSHAYNRIAIRIQCVI